MQTELDNNKSDSATCWVELRCWWEKCKYHQLCSGFGIWSLIWENMTVRAVFIFVLQVKEKHPKENTQVPPPFQLISLLYVVFEPNFMLKLGCMLNIILVQMMIIKWNQSETLLEIILNTNTIWKGLWIEVKVN